nr:rRNA 2'-O-methyltransferase fibrillarin-like [Coffea arabica]
MEDFDIKFNVIVSLFNWMQKSKSSSMKRSKFRKFLDAFCQKPGDYFSAIRGVAGGGGRAGERAGGWQGRGLRRGGGGRSWGKGRGWAGGESGGEAGEKAEVAGRSWERAGDAGKKGRVAGGSLEKAGVLWQRKGQGRGGQGRGGGGRSGRGGRGIGVAGGRRLRWREEKGKGRRGVAGVTAAGRLEATARKSFLRGVWNKIVGPLTSISRKKYFPLITSDVAISLNSCRALATSSDVMQMNSK